MTKILTLILITWFVVTCVPSDSDKGQLSSVNYRKLTSLEKHIGNRSHRHQKRQNSGRQRRCRRNVRLYWCNQPCNPCFPCRRCLTDLYVNPQYQQTTMRNTYRPTYRPRPRPTTRPPCNCDPDGSKFPTCDDKGVCICKHHYTGRTCNSCKHGYWKNYQKHCVECTCNPDGTLENTTCDQENGKCHCKKGVGGHNCEQCLPNHYGNIATGCKRCDPCNKKGHICDPNNGKCVCPYLTRGEECEECIANSWGYHPHEGCKECNCSESGSSILQCNLKDGKCTCKAGYEGKLCDMCSFGYFGYPNCRKCSCSVNGTQEAECHSGLCRCDPNGNCKCKKNVEGTNCNVCKPKSFGLSKDNPSGCLDCFCFGRSDKCSEANYHWNKIRKEKSHVDSHKISSDIWMLPDPFRGDLTTSYGGYLSVSTSTEGEFDVTISSKDVELRSKGYKEIQMIESGWTVSKLSDEFPGSCRTHFSRDCFMTMLQKVKSIVIKTDHWIQEVLLDKAEADLHTYPVTHTIEQCDCPKEFSGLSCQNPNKGYYRFIPTEPSENWIDRIIGRAVRCNCNGHSDNCDPETGYCKDCQHNTLGNYCELCDVGYYKDKDDKCVPCLCPTADQNNAKSCSRTTDGFKCDCKEGYKGQFCNECSEGYYSANVTEHSLRCIPCSCNLYGAKGGLNICDSHGKCECKEGFKGDKCNQCIKEREFIKDGICTPCDECTQRLFNEIDKLTLAVDDTFKLFDNGIAPPWTKLADNLSKHKILSEKFKNQQEKIEILLSNATIDHIEAEMTEMDEHLALSEQNAEQNVLNIDRTLDKSMKMIEEAVNLEEKLIDTITKLKEFSTKHVDLNEALDNAHEILNHIYALSDKLDVKNNHNVLYKCSNISQQVELIYRPSMAVPGDILELTRRLDNINNITNFIANRSILAEELNLRNSQRIVKLKANIEKLKGRNQYFNSTIGNTVSKLQSVSDLLDTMELIYKDMLAIKDFGEMKKLRNRIRRNEEASQTIEALYEQALIHVQDLEAKISSYQGIFNFTKDEWKKINASGAYESIKSGIRKAKQMVTMSQDLLRNATTILNPSDSDDLLVRTNLAHAYSDRLKQRINNIKDLSKNISNIKNQLDKLKYSILQSGKSNNELTQILHKMEDEITSHSDRVSKLEDATRNSSRISEDMNNLMKNIDRLYFQKEYIFSKDYQNFMNFTNINEIKNMMKKLNATTKTLQNQNITSKSIDNIYQSMMGDRNLKSIEDKINNLKNKILYAKQAADMVNVAMNLTKCKMTYLLQNPSSIFQSLSITYKCENCQLLKWPQENKVILGLHVVNNKTILTLNDKNTVMDNRNSEEKTIHMKKVGNWLDVQIEDEKKLVLLDNDDLNFINQNETIEIGSLDEDSKGYVAEVILNNQIFGAWNFIKTEGHCTGQKRDTKDSTSSRKTHYYNGNGYMMYGTDKNLKPTMFIMGFEFYTFDMNSLIYLANDGSCAFVALYLEDGYVVFHVVHENNRTNIQKSSSRCNHGKRCTAEIRMNYSSKTEQQSYRLHVNNDGHPSLRNSPLKARHVFKIKNAYHYVGGVQPTFNNSCIKINKTSFLGILNFESTPPDNKTMSYGVIRSTKKDLDFPNAWVNKNGEVVMKYPKITIDSLKIILRPTQPNGIVMTINNLKIWLYDYKLNMNEHNLTIPKLKEDEYNEIEINITSVLQQHISSDTLKLGDSKDGFDGSIAHITLNNSPISFNSTTVSNFTNAEIGRDRPFLAKKPNVSTKTLVMSTLTNSMQNTEGCTSFGAYQTDPNAVKFGDKPDSYTHLKTNFVRNNFSIQFELRTFYSNGLLFISYNARNNHYFILEIHNGKLQLLIKGKKKPVIIVFSKKLNDGRWHKIQLVKKKRKFLADIDLEERKRFRSPKFKVNEEVFLGGVPIHSDKFAYLETQIIPFRGCIRFLIINDEKKVLIKKNKNITHSNIRQCFPDIEEGAYFGGDAYAIYKDDFHVSKTLMLSFEFRTGEQNGVLLSVSDPHNSPALSVELQNGDVVMAADTGNNLVTNVTNNLDSEFALCDNRWHKVTAIYSSSELTVSVDGVTEIWVISDAASSMDELEAPLYIGGLPDEVPTGTLKSRENFKGCIKNFKINGKQTEWSNMKELSNVMLNSCPLVHT